MRRWEMTKEHVARQKMITQRLKRKGAATRQCSNGEAGSINKDSHDWAARAATRSG
jgi:hypothetical protein